VHTPPLPAWANFSIMMLNTPEVAVNFLSHREGGTVFYQRFLFSPLQCTVTARNCKKLCEFEETEISRQSCRDDCE
jgi:hypothetical protein